MPDPKPIPPNQKRTAQPSSGFLQRMLGSETFSPEQQQGIDIARKENPSLAPVKPYGPISRILQPNSLAYVSGGSNIYMNTAANEGQSPQDIADTLTHEQTHVNQKSAHGPTMNFLLSLLDRSNQEGYGRNPDELAAFMAEKDRRARMGRPQTPIPSFDRPGEFFTPKDINLPSTRSYAPSKQITNSPVTMR
jgi:hypothetical protein